MDRNHQNSEEKEAELQVRLNSGDRSLDQHALLVTTLVTHPHNHGPSHGLRRTSWSLVAKGRTKLTSLEALFTRTMVSWRSFPSGSRITTPRSK